MARASDEGRDRRGELVAAAAGVFLRYGFRKTSMDDLARAAGLSRQGLYLHFETKDALFREVVGHVVDTTRAAYREALARPGVDVRQRLLDAFEAFHGHAIGGAGEAQMNELLEAATQLVGDVALRLEESFVAELAKVLEKAGAARAWRPARLGAATLAANLYATSLGLKHRARTLAEFRERLDVAVRMTLAGAPLSRP